MVWKTQDYFFHLPRTLALGAGRGALILHHVATLHGSHFLGPLCVTSSPGRELGFSYNMAAGFQKSQRESCEAS